LKRPAFQFYPADWRKDVELQSCSMAAQGLWINVMCLAHECEPYGHLTINGKGMTPAQLGRQVGLSAKECESLLDELLDTGVARRTDEGVVFSSRMVRDEDLRNRRAAGGNGGAEHGIKGAEAGSKGGRPRKDKGGSETPLPGFEEPPPSSSSSSSSSEKKESNDSSSPAKLPTCPVQSIVDLYHQVLPELPKVRVMDKSREKAIRDRWAWVLTTNKPDGTRRAETAEQGVEWFRTYFERTRDNDFLMGKTPRAGEHANWRPDIEFLLKSQGLKHVLEKTMEPA
jgi:hypothetical protein